MVVRFSCGNQGEKRRSLPLLALIVQAGCHQVCLICCRIPRRYIRSVSPGTCDINGSASVRRAPVRGTQINLRHQTVKQKCGEWHRLLHPRFKRFFTFFSYQRVRVFAIKENISVADGRLSCKAAPFPALARRHRGLHGRRHNSK